jgi:hypothetical protein
MTLFQGLAISMSGNIGNGDIVEVTTSIERQVKFYEKGTTSEKIVEVLNQI